jgi:hypothetical protein
LSKEKKEKKIKIEQHETRQKSGVNLDAPEGILVPAPHVTPVVLLLNKTNIIIII